MNPLLPPPAPQVLGEVHSLRPSLSSYPALCGEAFAHRAARRGASRHVADWWRTVAARTCLCVQFATYYLTTVAELIYFEQFFGQVRARVLPFFLKPVHTYRVGRSILGLATYYCTTVAELICFCEQFFG